MLREWIFAGLLRPVRLAAIMRHRQSLQSQPLLRTCRHRRLARNPAHPRSDLGIHRYDCQGIGRFEPEQAYARGIADLDALAELLPGPGFLSGAAPRSADAGLYGFLANILFYPIETPLKAHLVTKAGLVAHCRALHGLIGG
ncbi:MAG TPA: glutathione S-transferase C-terminal domain-containing protein [Acetobacteraceae bacterium]